VGQAALMMDWARAFAPRPVAQVLLSAGDIQDRSRYVNARNALEASFALGSIPIINENDTVAVAELKLGDNDTLSAWVAYLVDADQLILLTDVDGLYTANPRNDSSAKRIPVVSELSQVEHLGGSAGSARGTGGMATKLKAARIACDAGIETVILGGGGLGLEAWSRGADTGTRILAGKGAARRGWMLHQPTRGTLQVDAGAQKAVRDGRSLLPRGLLSVDGAFGAGELVALEHDGKRVAHGLSNYSASELVRIAGRHSSEIEAILGHRDYEEVVHRSNLVLVEDAKSTG
jgi:glutamate 5-kinase